MIMTNPNYVCGLSLLLYISANLLVKRGVDNIRILEAKDHIGGRAATEIHEFEGNQIPVDMGAMWLHGASKNILSKLAAKYNVNTPVSTYDTILYNRQDGTTYDKDEVEEYREKLFEEGFFSLQEHRQMTTDYDEPLKTSSDLFLNQLATEEEKKLTKFFLRSGVEMEYSGLLKDHSLWWWNDDYDLGGSIDTDDYFVPQGQSSLFQPFASYLTENNKIQLNAPVSCIDYQNKDIAHVHYIDEDGNSAICRARKVIVTVPLGILKTNRISFLPKLPRRMQKSIRRIGMGKMNKIFMFWSKEDLFWPRDAEILGDLEERDSNFLFCNPRQYNGDLPFLYAFFQGSLAEAAEEAYAQKEIEKYESRIRDLAMESLRSMFGDAVPMPKKVLVTNWNVDEYTMGAYSFNKVDMGKLDRYFLTQPVGKDQLFFAGEATHRRYFATTAGAFMTGRTAARKVLKALKLEAPAS